MARQVGEIRSRWEWTQGSVWTERMLAALERGVKGGKWFSLIDKMYATESLDAALQKVRSNGGSPGVDHQTIEMFEENLRKNIETLSEQLKAGSYRASPVRRKMIAKAGGGERPLGIPTVRDRIVQTALRNVIEPIFEKTFAPQSYGFRPGRGCKDALREVNCLLENGFVHVVDADLKSYFDTIDHEIMMLLVEEHISDGRILDLLRMLLEQKVMASCAEWTPERGTPQGAVISPLLANIYLNELDHRMAALGFKMVRYADDFVVLCASEHQAREALAEIREWVQSRKLTLHPEKTRVVDARERGGFDFLGYHFERGFKTPRKKSMEKLKDRVRELTPRKNGHSLERIITTLNRSLRGWFEYFKHSERWAFRDIDAWVRMRLRRILAKRERKTTIGRSANMRWPNIYFHERGLFSMAATREAHCRSARR